MNADPRHYTVWPPGLPHSLGAMPRSLYDNLANAAAAWPDKPGILFYDTPLSYAEIQAGAEAVAGYLQQVCGVAQGDRVMLYLQSTPQFIIGYYGILRAGAVVVPVNPMNRAVELAHVQEDSGARVIIAAQDLMEHVHPRLGGPGGIARAVVVTYSDYLRQPTTLTVPEFVSAPAAPVAGPGMIAWREVIAAGYVPAPYQASADDLAVLPYTSGSSGKPKGCRHTHATTMHALFSVSDWFGIRHEDVVLAVAPLFHVTGMQAAMNAPIERGCTMVLLPRWDREAAARLIAHNRVSVWPAIPTMGVDLLTLPDIDAYDLSSIRVMFGGGVAMPEAIAERLREKCGITFLEGYGMTETMAPTTANPPQRPLRQCGGVPVFDTVVRIADPITFAALPPGEVGEILISGPQLFKGYWNRDEAENGFLDLDGRRFFRSGDLGRMDEQGYVFLVDRLKRMVNVSGYKVWPAEVEALMYAHPAIQEVCVVGTPDARSGETVKALIVLKPEAAETTEAEIIAWARDTMSAYKAPRVVEFMDALPRSGTGKIQWLALQQREQAGQQSEKGQA